MTRRIDPRLWPLAVGLTVTVLAGCASAPAPGQDAGADGLRVRLTSTGPGGAAGAGTPDAARGNATAPGSGDAMGSGQAEAAEATALLGLPLPKEFEEAAALRDVYFEFDRATLRPEDARVLDRNARWLETHPGTLVLIEGHADDRGTNEYNLALAESRARVARAQLVARGVARSRITTLSYGEERPACRQAGEGCWTQNRRAHFLVKSAVAAHTIMP